MVAWRGPLAVVSEVPAGEFPDIAYTEPEHREPRTEHYREDIPVALIAAGLIALTFLPWYKIGSLSYSAWSTGTWGPVVAFLAAVSIALVAFRRAGVSVSLPVDESLVHEGIGWLALIGSVIKSRYRPGPAGTLDTNYLIAYLSMGAAVALALLAGRMSPHAPLVVRPGWSRGKGGRIGLVVILIGIAGAAAFGSINTTKIGAAADNGLSAEELAKRYPGYVQGLPDCAKAVPVPSGLEPASGINSPDACQATFSTKQTLADVLTRFRAALKAKSWKFTETEQGGVTLISFTAPRCGAAAIISVPQGGTAVTLALTPCASPTATP